jgi:hypothetical protein
MGDSSVTIEVGGDTTPPPATDAAIDAAVTAANAGIGRALALLASDGAVPPIEYISVPLPLMRAALLCASRDEDHPEINGVRIAAAPERGVRVTATDGARMLTAWFRPATFMGLSPDWAEQGVTIPREGLAARLALLGGDGAETVHVGFARHAPHVVLRDVHESIVFRMPPVEEAFYDVAPLLASLSTVLGDRTQDALDTAAFAPAVLRSASDVARALGATAIALYQGGSSIPAVCTFEGADGAALILLPARETAPMSHETIRALSPAMRGTRAAIQANLTRTLVRLEAMGEKNPDRATLAAQVADYRQRLALIAAALDETTVLPAPEAPAPEAPAPEAPAPAPAAPAPAAPAKGKGKPSVRR